MSVNNLPIRRALEAHQSIGKPRSPSFQRELDVAKLEDTLQLAIWLTNQIQVPDHLDEEPVDGKEGDKGNKGKSGKVVPKAEKDDEERSDEDLGDQDEGSGDGDMGEQEDSDGNGPTKKGKGKEKEDPEASSKIGVNLDPSTYPPLVPTSNEDPEIGKPWIELEGAVLMFRCTKSRMLEPWYKFMRNADGERLMECTHHPIKDCKNEANNPYFTFPPKEYTHGEPQAKSQPKGPFEKPKVAAVAKKTGDANLDNKKK